MPRGFKGFEKLNREQDEILKIGKRGRDIELLELRNQTICYRYYYYGKIHKLRYEDVYEQLSKEFFLSQRTLVNIVGFNTSFIQEVYRSKINISTLKKLVPFLIWLDNQKHFLSK